MGSRRRCCCQGTGNLICNNCTIALSVTTIHLSWTHTHWGAESGTLTWQPLISTYGGTGTYGPDIAWNADISCDPVAGIVFHWCHVFSGSNWCCNTLTGLNITSLACSPSSFLMTVVPGTYAAGSECEAAVDNGQFTNWTMTS